MRWHTFVNPSPDEIRERARLDAAIDRWWRAFGETADTIRSHFSSKEVRGNFDLVKWMAQTLQSVDADLCWEYGPAVRGDGDRLVVTPESARQLRPLTERLLGRAPAIRGWEFYGFRLPESLDEALAAAQQRTDSEILITGIECNLGKDRRVDLHCTIKPGRGEEAKDIAFSQAAIICATLLGEQVTDCWLGYIEITASRRAAAALDELKHRFERVLGEARAACDERPFWQRANNSEWTLYDLKRRAKDDEGRRSDLFVYRTMDTTFFGTLMAGAPFYSSRLSVCGERFCYLMLDGRDAEMEGFADKGAIEDALEASLVASRQGAVIGSGTGRRYSYIDLAVVDVHRGCDAIVHALRQGRIAKNSWILFHDDEWRDEWIGVYDDTPPPPL